MFRPVIGHNPSHTRDQHNKDDPQWRNTTITDIHSKILVSQNNLLFFKHILSTNVLTLARQHMHVIHVKNFL
jgi:hypothetical protein